MSEKKSIAVESSFKDYQVVDAKSVIVNSVFFVSFPISFLSTQNQSDARPRTDKTYSMYLSVTTLFSMSTLRTLSIPPMPTTPLMHPSKSSCFHSAFIHRVHRRVQRLYNLAWRHVHDVGVCKLTPLSLRLEGLDTVIEICVCNIFSIKDVGMI